jgi:hypothetical protein
MIKRAYSTVYPDVSKEEIYWIKLKVNNEINSGETVIEPEGVSGSPEIYTFFILMLTDKTTMQSIILNMLEEANLSVTPVDTQRSAINRLRLTFFEGF